jgi:hypothetical protein
MWRYISTAAIKGLSSLTFPALAMLLGLILQMVEIQADNNKWGSARFPHRDEDTSDTIVPSGKGKAHQRRAFRLDEASRSTAVQTHMQGNRRLGTYDAQVITWESSIKAEGNVPEPVTYVNMAAAGKHIRNFGVFFKN